VLLISQLVLLALVAASAAISSLPIRVISAIRGYMLAARPPQDIRGFFFTFTDRVVHPYEGCWMD
jgi:hypothetical protein